MTLNINEKVNKAQQTAIEYFFNTYPDSQPFEKLMALDKDKDCTSEGFEFAYPEIMESTHTPYLQQMVARLALMMV